MTHFNVRLEKGAILGRLGRIKARLAEPLGEGRGEMLAELVIRNGGEGSVRDMFERGMSGDGIPWPPPKPFGNYDGANPPLNRSGAYKDAWMDEGPGALTIIAGNRLDIGVDRTLFPQVRVFQKKSSTTIFAKDANRVTKEGRLKGRLKMQVKLGMEYGVWLTEEKLLIKGLVLEPRPVRAGAELRTSYKRALASLLVGRGIEP